MNLLKQIVKNTTLVFFARLANTIFGIFTTIIVARHLTVEGYGQYAFTLSLISFTVHFIDFGNFQVITRELSAKREKTNDIVGTVIILRAFVSIVFLITIFLIVYFLKIPAPVKTAVYIVTAPQLFFSLNTIYVAVFTAHGRFGFDALMQIASRGGEFVFMLLVVGINFGFVALFVGMGIANLLTGAFGTILYLKSFGTPTFRVDFNTWKYIISESLPIAITTLFTLGMLRIDIFVLQAFKGSTDVALFSAPYQIINALQMAPLSFVSVIFPTLCKLGNAEDMRSAFILSYEKAFKFLYIIALPASMLLVFLSKDFINIIFGSKYSASATALSIMGPTILFIFINPLNAFSLISIKKQRLNTISTIVAFIINLVADLLLIPKLGYHGAAIGTVLGSTVLFALSSYFVLKDLEWLNLSRILPRPFWGAIAMALFINFFNSANAFFIVLPASIAVYFLSLLVCKVFPSEEIQIIKSALRRG